MPGAVKHVEVNAGQLHRVAFLQKAIGLNVLSLGDAVFDTLRFDLVEQPLIIFVRTDDGAASALLDGSRRANVIDMPVRQPDCHNFDTRFIGNSHQTVDLAAWVDEGAFQGFGGPDERGVLL